MSVTGYLALYTTLIGWQEYQKLWELMVGTGIVFIPFLGIILQCFLEPFESQEPKSAAVVTLRRLMIRLIGALVIIEFCCVPTIALQPKVLHFEPMCVASPKIATPGHTGTTYDNKFPVPTGIKVPILWYLVMAISNGFTHAAIKSIPCSPINYQQLQNQLNTSAIESPKLKKETIAFYNNCYVPSYALYMGHELNDNQKNQIAAAQKKYGKDDLAWIGSHALLTTPGFYIHHFAREPIPGFPFDSTRDQFPGQAVQHSKWGEPSCQQWWNAPNIGLHQRLQTALPPSFLKSIFHIGTSSKQLADLGIRRMIERSFGDGNNHSEIARGYGSLDHSNVLFKMIGQVGISLHQLSYEPKLYLLINALPVIQALLLLVIYALLALVIPFSSYRLHFIITGAAITFAITFWSYLWALSATINNWLIEAIYPSTDSIPLSIFSILRVGENSVQQTFLHFIVGTLYLALPFIFLMLMGWAGLKVSTNIMSTVNNMQAPGDASAEAGSSAMKRAVTMIMRATM